MRIYHRVRARLVEWMCFEFAHEIRFRFEWWKASGIPFEIEKNLSEFKGRENNAKHVFSISQRFQEERSEQND